MNDEITQRIGRVQTAEKNIQLNFWIIGSELVEIKDATQHGEFEKLIEDNFTFNKRTAQRFMLISRKYKNDNVSHLGLRNALDLIEHVPEEELDKDGKIDIDNYVEGEEEEDDDDYYEYEEPKPSQKPTVVLPQEEEDKIIEAEVNQKIQESKSQKGYFQWVHNQLIFYNFRLQKLVSYINGINLPDRKKEFLKFKGREEIVRRSKEFKENINKMEDIS
jgi:hypothetical protein|tara:strand:+ start:37871 stop:38527 length:657 start_codon:yes stop_codon:yes gene_type:complete